MIPSHCDIDTRDEDEMSEQAPAVEPIGEGVIGPAERRQEEKIVFSATVDPTTGPTVRKSFGSKQEFRPDHVSVTFERRDGDEWDLGKITASGHRLLKGDRLGEHRLTESWGTFGESWKGACPAWLAAWGREREAELPA